jgi:hypothetical protein
VEEGSVRGGRDRRGGRRIGVRAEQLRGIERRLERELERHGELGILDRQ